MNVTVVSMSRIEGGMSSSGRVSGIVLPLSANYQHSWRIASEKLTSVNETHGNMELGQVKLAPVVNVRKIPKMNELDVPRSKCALVVRDNSRKFACARHHGIDNSPNLHQIIPAEARLSEDFTSHLSADKAIAGLVPGSKDLVIVLLLLLR
jgi:hypothetical protein